jgi:multiple sugar transport system substrate-binding protein
MRNYLIITMIMVVGFLVACSNESDIATNGDAGDVDESNEVDIHDDPVTITMWHYMGEEHFNEYYKEPVEEAFDHITFELVHAGPDGGEDGADIQDLLSAGMTPDIIWGGAPWQIQLFSDYDLTGDIR